MDGKRVHLLLNNLEWEAMDAKLTVFKDGDNPIVGVRQKRLMLDKSLGKQGQPVLENSALKRLPNRVTLSGNEMMILEIEYRDEVKLSKKSIEKKYFGESLTDGVAAHRVTLNDQPLTAQIKNVAVPEMGEAMLRITGKYFYLHVTADDPRIPDDVVMTIKWS